jgi:hypothetical protein
MTVILIIAGGAALIALVATVLSVIKDPILPNRLEGSLERTKQIVAYMKRLLKNPDKLQDMVIRIQAGFSSLSNISYSEGENQKYSDLLEKERDLLIELMEVGATLRVILNPPFGPKVLNNPRWQARLNRLIKFLDRDADYMRRCEFAILTDIQESNLLFFGRDVLFEGLKTSEQKGYGLTVVHRNGEVLQAKVEGFDNLFELAREYTLKTFGSPDDPKSEIEALRRAVIGALKQAKGGQELPRS